MKFLNKAVMFLFLTISCGLFFLDPDDAQAKSNWHPYNDLLFGYAKRQKILKYSSTGWGDFDGYQHTLFSSKRHPQYKYTRKNRTVLIRYNTVSPYLKAKYNYRKIKISHGAKTPIFSYWFKYQNEGWTYINTIEFWMVKPIRF